jgi:hypothetical protein
MIKRFSKKPIIEARKQWCSEKKHDIYYDSGHSFKVHRYILDKISFNKDHGKKACLDLLLALVAAVLRFIIPRETKLSASVKFENGTCGSN